MIFNTISIIFFLIFINGCSIKDVKPWEKATHAKETMKDGGVNALANKFDAHIFYSKEATKAGNGISGGGCGCN